MYILLIIIASITGEPAKLYTYTTDTLEQCKHQEEYIYKNYDNPAKVIVQSGCYVKGEMY
jgi:hypothetical protein